MLLVVVAVAGCDPAKKKTEESGNGDEPALPRASVTLRVAVVSDDALARAIDRLAGEWGTLTDGQIETVPVAAETDLVAAAAEADLIVFPSRAIGELAESNAIRPIRGNVLKSETLRFEDFLPLVRDHEVVYGRQVLALPIGCPTPLLLVPADGEGGSFALPDDDVQLALAYLAWAAPHAVHRSRVATLFDADDFSPRLAAPPFVRALESFVETAGAGPGSVVWPQRDRKLERGVRFAVEQLPSADEAYNALADVWETSAEGDRHATLVASRGRLIAVTAATRNAATAFRYAGWLVSPENARELSGASDNVANCRGSFARAGDAWFGSADRELSRAFSAVTADALRTDRYLMAPRLPGSEEYLKALGARVRAALGGAPVTETLSGAAADWEAISVSRGRDQQGAAYARSLNAERLRAAGG